MNIHEYQAKTLFRDYGVAIQQGQLALTADEAEAACTTLGGKLWVVKAQVHAGGRGKGGGIRLCRTPGEARDAAEALLGSQLVTPQTGPEGVTVGAVYVEAGCDIARELYLGMVLDRDSERMVMMASTEGGVEIEEVAAAPLAANPEPSHSHKSGPVTLSAEIITTLSHLPVLIQSSAMLNDAAADAQARFKVLLGPLIPVNWPNCE